MNSTVSFRWISQNSYINEILELGSILLHCFPLWLRLDDSKREVYFNHHTFCRPFYFTGVDVSYGGLGTIVIFDMTFSILCANMCWKQCCRIPSDFLRPRPAKKKREIERYTFPEITLTLEIASAPYLIDRDGIRELYRTSYNLNVDLFD